MNTEFHKLEVLATDPDLGKRLDLYIALNLKDYSRSLIKKIIETNQVLVNGIVNFKAGYKVSIGDKIEFPKQTTLTGNEKLEPANFTLEILHEDDDYLFINKPIGISVHPANINEKNTVANQLVSKYANLPGNIVSRPGIVHRLDRDTSGVLVVAKSPKALWWLSGRFADRQVTKKYISIGMGENLLQNFTENFSFEISGFMKRSSENRKQFKLHKEQIDGSRFSSTQFHIEKITNFANKNLIFFEITPKTGRTHQIRVHQKSFNFPIIGDKLYLSRKELETSSTILRSAKIENRMFLHAYSISFENFDGKIYSVQSEIPKDFEKLMNI